MTIDLRGGPGHRDETRRPDLSVVVASVESAHTIAAALDALTRSCGDMSHEIFVVDASRDRSAELAGAYGGPVQVVDHPVGTLVPSLWADGIRRSSGRWVALSTGHCVVPDGWAEAMVRGLEMGAAGVGAGLRPLPGIRAVDRAVFFLRYTGFLEITRGSARSVPDLPGDNVAYPGDSVREFMSRTDRGFWELEYHGELIDAGGELWVEPNATAGFGRSFRFTTIMRHRFDHGRHFGSWRASEGREGRWRVVLPAPLVPLVLLARVTSRVRAFPEIRVGLVTAIPPFLALATAWAVGEAIGALTASRSEAQAE
jgi:Glycosyl transferase family 2